MMRLLFLIIFLLAGIFPLHAEQPADIDKAFAKQLDNIKDPFQDGLPKPVVVVPPPVVVHHAPPPKPVPKPQPKPEEVHLPEMHLQGVMVGDDMHEAIIDDEEVPLMGTIKGAKLVAITRTGVEMSYKNKKFFLKVE